MKLVLRNVLLAPLVLLRLVTILPLTIISHLLETVALYLDVILPTFKRMPVNKEELEQRRKDVIKSYLKLTQKKN